MDIVVVALAIALGVVAYTWMLYCIHVRRLNRVQRQHKLEILIMIDRVADSRRLDNEMMDVAALRRLWSTQEVQNGEPQPGMIT